MRTIAEVKKKQINKTEKKTIVPRDKSFRRVLKVCTRRDPVATVEPSGRKNKIKNKSPVVKPVMFIAFRGEVCRTGARGLY